MHEDEDDNDASKVRRLTAFFEPEYPELPENEIYVAGFKDQDGDRWGVVPLPRSMVDREVFLTNWFQPQVQADGMVRIWPMDVSDEVFKEMQETGNSLVVPLDTLIAERLDMNMDMPDYDEDGVLAAYGLLQHRLKAALELVDDEISRRYRRNLAPGSDRIN